MQTRSKQKENSNTTAPYDDIASESKRRGRQNEDSAQIEERSEKCQKVEGFNSCLKLVEGEGDEDIEASGPGQVPILARSLSSRELNDEGWLSSPFMDIVFDRFAKFYPNVHFMSSDFAALSLTSKNAKNDYYEFTDLLGKKVIQNDEKHKDIVFVYNSNGIHWNLVRVQMGPSKELQLFEPMGKPTMRRGLNIRSLPRGLVAWLDTCRPFEKSWLSVGVSAITNQQQFTTYDCGVACLLYAEKCGMQQTKERIDMETDQADMTSYRTHLQAFLSSDRF